MKSILLVDDADVTRDAYAMFIEWAGFRALVAGNGAEAYEIARAQKPDLIVMDLNMPVLDGWEAARKMKADPLTAGIPLIAVSAWLMRPEDEAKFQECGFSALCTKPLPPSTLLDEIRTRLGLEAHAA